MSQDELVKQKMANSVYVIHSEDGELIEFEPDGFDFYTDEAIEMIDEATTDLVIRLATR